MPGLTPSGTSSGSTWWQGRSRKLHLGRRGWNDEGGEVKEGGDRHLGRGIESEEKKKKDRFEERGGGPSTMDCENCTRSLKSSSSILSQPVRG